MIVNRRLVKKKYYTKLVKKHKNSFLILLKKLCSKKNKSFICEKCQDGSYKMRAVDCMRKNDLSFHEN